jgi:hypothetical protein
MINADTATMTDDGYDDVDAFADWLVALPR